MFVFCLYTFKILDLFIPDITLQSEYKEHYYYYYYCFYWV